MSEVLSCFDPAANPDGMLSVAESLQQILSKIAMLGEAEPVELSGCTNRVIAQDLVSAINVPPHSNSAMDGFAVAADGLIANNPLKVVGSVYAGADFSKRLAKGEAVEIMTGAPIPEGADTIVIREASTLNGDQVSFIGPVKKGQHVRQAGEDIAVGDIALTKGTLLRPQEVGLAASLGFTKLDVFKRPTVAVFSTGDEVTCQGAPLPKNCIYDTNRFTLQGLLKRLGCRVIDFGIIEDTQLEMEKVLLKASQEADLVLSSGGVSMGNADYIRQALEAVGQINFWKIAMRPGRPIAFGKINQTPFFGLPGNPVAVMVTFTQFVQPALRKMMGQSGWNPQRMTALTIDKLKSRYNRTDYIRGIYSIDESGQLVVSSTGSQGSGILTSMARANCFIEIPDELESVQSGQRVVIQPFADLL